MPDATNDELHTHQTIVVHLERLETKFDGMVTIQEDCKTLLEGDNRSGTKGLKTRVALLEQKAAIVYAGLGTGWVALIAFFSAWYK
jgi:hypothetical protein|tara:strand:- start:1640 stop:1897 length:258 start_codon:yes stop_codon:yes gene_type:complete